MATESNDLESKIFALSTEERAKLAEHIIATLDSANDVNAEAQWLDEAERRYLAYREGKLDSKPAHEVFEDAFKNLK